jgi:NAD+ kinase
MKWAIVAKGGISHVRKEAMWLAEHLTEHDQEVLLEQDLASAEGKQGHSMVDLDKEVDLFMTVGGDGTILMTQHYTQKPVFGVNAGAIGFLAEVEPPQALDAIARIIAGKYRVEERNKLASWLDGERLPDGTNEVTLQTSRIAKLITYSIRVDDEVLDTIRGDGIIVASSAGSTGYAMSVGGPLVHPAVKAMVLAPIAPFRLAARPFVIPQDSVVEISVLPRDSQMTDEQAKAVIDGRHAVAVRTRGTLRVAASENMARFVRLDTGFYERVRTKLTR